MMKLFYSLLTGIVLAVIAGGCSMEPKKMPCTDIDVLTKFEREIYVLKTRALPPESEPKFRAARILYQNVDFTFARDTDILAKIFGAQDAHRGKVLGNDTIVFQYVWNNEYVRFAFMGVGNVITGCEVKMDTYKK